MIQRLFSVVTLMLCVIAIAATVTLWLCSYRTALWLQLGHYDSASQSIVGSIFAAEVASGRLVLTREDVNLSDHPNPHPNVWKLSCFLNANTASAEPVEPDQLWRFAAYRYRFGFEYADWTTMGSRDRSVALPMWFVSGVMVLAFVLPMRRQWRRWRRLRRGACGSCGYDLRATPDRCPECGTAVRSNFAG